MSLFKNGDSVVVSNNNLLSYCTKGVVLKTLDKKGIVLVSWLDGAPPLRIKEDNLSKIELVIKYSPVFILSGVRSKTGLFDTKEEAQEIINRYEYTKDLGLDLGFDIEEEEIYTGGGVPFTL
ncbi:hypothetical protein HWB19_gp003 [Cronobacter phage vB_CsaP_009]|uniref:Uncharacterized protein n=1 Tax=Cronobacter phage vB_CsaP_009 TaxID=2699738 RepID=A0A679FDT5_9CAUD|nr:hypothetical protein HWB19_gp003 [Cronobacter phage vB_CsaP_009]BBU72649.1 hypothetical protein [Cronobacter phage vB_CsaP_009]